MAIATQTTVSSARAVIFHYNSLITSGTNPNLAVTQYDIQKDILSFEFTKLLAQPSGTFTLQLTADTNWKRKVFPNDWVLVYLSNEGVESLRMFGNIDRVSQFTTKNDKGLLETNYIISGRDFGKVFDTTNIWFNPTNAVRMLLETQILKGNPTELIDNLLKVFLGGKITSATIREQPQLNQWVIPSELATYFSASPSISTVGDGLKRFYDILFLDLQSGLSGYKVIQSLATLQGNLWSILKTNSNDVINELYLELLNDYPTIVLRTKPFVRSGYSGGSISSEINKFTDLETVYVRGEDIVGTDIGYADHERFNLFLLVATSDFLGVEELLTKIQPEYPKINIASIKRHGLRLLYVDTDFALFSGSGKNSKINPRLLLDWNRLSFEFFNNALFMESGTIELGKANPDIKIGKALHIEESTINQDKMFYIEGYTDSWSYPGNWKQTLQLTRGIYLIDGKEKFGYQQESLDTIYTGQNIVKRTDRKGRKSNV